MEKVVGVLTSRPRLDILSYRVPEGASVKKGQFVEINLRGKVEVGVVFEDHAEASVKNLKTIDNVLDFETLSQNVMDFITWAAAYYVCSRGAFLKLLLVSKQLLEEPKRKPKEIEFKEPLRKDLSGDQEKAFVQLKHIYDQKQFQTCLLEGVTGSGKTEVYFDLVDEVLKKGEQVLIMLPEIALSTQFTKRFETRFGYKPIVWHSGITPAQRRNAFQSILRGETKVVIGARSALFLPFQKLGLIVVDEEHDGSYKQDEGICYQARDLAVVYGKILKRPVVLVSATPSLETVQNVRLSKYVHIHLKERYGDAVMPEIHAVDLRRDPPPKKEWLSPVLIKALRENLDKGNQSLLFLNRRGYAPVAMCRKCSHRLQCTSCSSMLVYHAFLKEFVCHHCGYAMKLNNNHCLACGEEDALILCGPGVERIEEEVQKHFKDARTLTLSSDLTSSPKKLREAIDAVEKGEVDFIVGTQMISKGYHFPKLTLVGVVDGDLGFGGADLRTAEKTYQLLHQVSGRAGREKQQGHVYLQTSAPDEPLMQALIHGQTEKLMAVELENRKLMHMPPYGRLVSFIFASENEYLAEKAAHHFLGFAPKHEGIKVLGPAPSPLFLKRGSYRYRLLMKVESGLSVQKILNAWLPQTPEFPGVKRQVDIDPYTFL